MKKKIILTYGILGGLILTAFSYVIFGLVSDPADMSTGMVLGFTTMIVAMSTIFIGIKKQRDTQGGEISFGQAFGTGILISLITCAFYVVGWLIYSHYFFPYFSAKYMSYAIEEINKSSKNAAEKAAEIAGMKKNMEMYDSNIFIKAAITLTEVLPVGVVLTLISALILKRKNKPQQQAVA